MNEQTIFIQALETDDPAERAAFLDHVCAGDEALRQRIERLLARHQQADGLLDNPAIAAGVTGEYTPEPGSEQLRTLMTGTQTPSGSVIGPYKLLQQIGEGGMGSVYIAAQTEPVRRQVALKIIKPGMDSRQVVARFEAERQALALMDHPNIAKVLDCGETPPAYAGGSPRPYFVMELVNGVPITKFCDQHRLSPRERLELFVPVCQAVQHAHLKGIIHRDLKPSNVLVALYDDKPVPKVIDFGIAKATAQKLTDRTMFTELGQVVGTLEYMSPEQAGLNQLDIDTRSDIYSLGVILYELLTGTTPLERKRLKEGALLEVLRLIREEEPPRPSTRLSATDELPAIAANRGLEPRKLSGLIRGELDWVVMKALDKDRSRRYDSANGFAADIQRYLGDLPVAACPPTAWYRLRKFAQRNKTGLLATGAALVAFLLVSVAIGWGLWDRAVQESQRRQEWSDRLVQTEGTVNVALAKGGQLADQAQKRQAKTSQEAAAVLVLWDQAQATLAEADAAVQTGAAEDRLLQRIADVRQRLDDGRREWEQRRSLLLRKEKLLRDLDEARFLTTAWFDNRFDYAGAVAKYQEAWAAIGLTIDVGRFKELAAKIRAEEPEVREALLVSLADWAYAATQAGTKPTAADLWNLSSLIDDDPWRNRFRRAWASRDRAALLDLAKQARKLQMDPANLHQLAYALISVKEEDQALALRRWACDQYPADFWLHYGLATLLKTRQLRRSPLELEEAIGCYRTALALRPDSNAVLHDLASALDDRSQWDEAIEILGKILSRDPNHWRAYNSLGVARKGKKQWDQAIAAFENAIKIHPNEAVLYTNLGDTWKQKGQLEKAIELHRKAIKMDERCFYAHMNLASALEALGELEPAQAEIQRALVIYPNHSAAHCNVGAFLLRQKRAAEAIKSFRRALELAPWEPQAHRGLGVALEECQQLEEAIVAYRTAAQLAPADPIIQQNLGHALLAAGRKPEALAAYQKAVALAPSAIDARVGLALVLATGNRSDEALAQYETSIRIDPANPIGHFGLGTFWLQKNEPSRAIAPLRQAIKLDPKHAETHSHLGSALARMNEHDVAIDEFGKALTINPKLKEAHHNLGISLAARDRKKEAIASYRRAVALDGANAEYLTDLGMALLADNQEDEAIAVSRKAVQLAPRLAKAHNNLGAALQAKLQYDEAILCYRRAIELDPTPGVCYYNLGMSCFAKQLWEESSKALKKRVGLEPRDEVAFLYLGNALMELRQFSAAEQAFRKLIALNPAQPAGQYGLGNARREQGDLAGARAAFEKAIQLAPHFAEAHCNLGNVLRSQGDFAASCKSLKEGERLAGFRKTWTYPSSKWLRESQRLLALEKKLPGVLHGEAIRTEDRLALAEMCWRYKKRYRDAADQYAQAFAEDLKAEGDLANQHCLNAACAAALAAALAAAQPIDEKEQVRLRKRALGWLRADIAARQRLLDSNPLTALKIEKDVQSLQSVAELSSLRDARQLAKIPAEESAAWKSFWTDVRKLARDARSSYVQTDLKGELVPKQRERTHPMTMTAGQTYVIEMESKSFDTVLKLTDAQGQPLAENDDISPANPNSRIVFAPKQDGTYRIVATLHGLHGEGPYVLTIRVFSGE
jgi:tetratricopeptide (TPR) repeat protein/serine/threonine protein kinase